MKKSRNKIKLEDLFIIAIGVAGIALLLQSEKAAAESISLFPGSVPSNTTGQAPLDFQIVYNGPALQH